MVIVLAGLFDGVATTTERSQQALAARLEALGDAQHQVEKLLLDVETGQRGYLLTGRPDFLEPYDDARQRLPAALDRVTELAAADPAQVGAARRMRTLAADELEYTAQTLTVHQSRGPEEARAVVASGQGKHVMDQLRTVIDTSATAGQEHREAYAAHAPAVADRAGRVRTGAATVVVVLPGLMLWLVRQREGAMERRRADARARETLLAELAHHAVHDPLTGLPNRRLLEDRIGQALTRSARDGTLVAVLFVDLDRFKHIDDRYGHAVGDRVLIAPRAAARDAAQHRHAGPPGRRRVRRAMRAAAGRVRGHGADRLGPGAAVVPGAVDDVTIDVTASAGVVVADHLAIRLSELHDGAPPSGPPDTEVLLAAADEAMHHAKRLGRARHHVYSTEVARARRDRVAMAGDLREALTGGQDVGGRLWVAFQPLVRLETGEPVGVEALCRWTHPQHGEVSPAEFIPVAESSGLITTLGDLVLQTACTQMSAWNASRAAAGLPALYISVNCSARQLLHPGCTDRLAAVLRETGTQPVNVVIELSRQRRRQRTPSASDAGSRRAPTSGDPRPLRR